MIAAPSHLGVLVSASSLLPSLPTLLPFEPVASPQSDLAGGQGSPRCSVSLSSVSKTTFIGMRKSISALH